MSSPSDDSPLVATAWRGAAPSLPPRIVAVGFRRINKMLQELAPDVADRATVDVLDVGFDDAVTRVKALQAQQPVDVWWPQAPTVLTFASTWMCRWCWSRWAAST